MDSQVKIKRNSRVSLSIELIDQLNSENSNDNIRDSATPSTSPYYSPPRTNESTKALLFRQSCVRRSKRKSGQFSDQLSPRKALQLVSDTSQLQNKESSTKQPKVRKPDSDDESFEDPLSVEKKSTHHKIIRSHDKLALQQSQFHHSQISNKYTYPSLNTKESVSSAFDKKSIFSKYFMCDLNVEHPCPGCGCSIGNDKNNYEIQSVIPWGGGADLPTDVWNMFPLCSRDESCGWGCSEHLERLEDTNAIDWFLLTYPNRLHEFCMRLQMIYGDLFKMSPQDTICLRFIRSVYQNGVNSASQATSSSTPSPTSPTSASPSAQSSSINRETMCRSAKVGFKADILDIADYFTMHTDRELVELLSFKRKYSPVKESARKLQCRSTTGSTTATATAGKLRSSSKLETTPLKLEHRLDYVAPHSLRSATSHPGMGTGTGLLNSITRFANEESSPSPTIEHIKRPLFPSISLDDQEAPQLLLTRPKDLFLQI